MSKKWQNAFTVQYPIITNVIQTKITFSSSFKSKNTKNISAIGIWDTGATSSVITKKIAKQCELIPISKTIVATAGGRVEQNVYFIDIVLPNNVLIQNVKVTEAEEIYGADALIGMDIMHLGDVAISNYGDKTTFSFRTPSVRTIDLVKEANRDNEKIANKNKRAILLNNKEKFNAPCPCGSGKKYRYCCGKEKIKQNQ